MLGTRTNALLQLCWPKYQRTAERHSCKENQSPPILSTSSVLLGEPFFKLNALIALSLPLYCGTICWPHDETVETYLWTRVEVVRAYPASLAIDEFLDTELLLAVPPPSWSGASLLQLEKMGLHKFWVLSLPGGTTVLGRLKRKVKRASVRKDLWPPSNLYLWKRTYLPLLSRGCMCNLGSTAGVIGFVLDTIYHGALCEPRLFSESLTKLFCCQGFLTCTESSPSGGCAGRGEAASQTTLQDFLGPLRPRWKWCVIKEFIISHRHFVCFL